MIDAQTQAALKELVAAIEKHYGPVEYIIMCPSFEDSLAFKRAAGIPIIRRRSSRRGLVQQKRAQLGLDTWGLIPGYKEQTGVRITRKMSYKNQVYRSRLATQGT